MMMRHYFTQLLICVALCACLFPQQSYAQDEFMTTPKNILKTNVLSPLWQAYSVTYERVISKRASLSVSVEYSDFRVDRGMDIYVRKHTTDVSGISATLAYTVYPFHRSPVLTGFFMSPFLRYCNHNAAILDHPLGVPKAKWTAFGGGFNIGHQWIIGRGTSINAYVGTGYSQGEVTPEPDFDFLKSQFHLGRLQFEFYPTAGISLGVAF